MSSTITLLWPAPYPTAMTTTSMTRVDTGDAVSPLPTWATSGGGVWVGTFTAPAAGLAYTIAATATISGVSRPINPWTFVDSAGGYVGRYISSEMLKKKYKEVNIAAYSSSDGGSIPSESSIQLAIETAEDEVDAEMTGGAYTIPFVATGSAIPRTITKVALAVAVLELSKIRLVQADDDQGKAFQEDVDKSMANLVRYRQGYPRQLPGVQLNSAISIKVEKINPNLSSTNCITLTPRFVLGYGWVVS